MLLFPRAKISPIFAILILSMPSIALAQDAEPLMETCAIFDELRIIKEPDSFTVSEALPLVDEILGVLGLTRKFEVLASYDTDNARAIILRDGKSQEIGRRFIIYNPDYVQANVSDNRWGVIGLLAHEIGHHLQGHTLNCVGSTPPTEIEADRFAGTVMGKLGATERQAVQLWKQLPEQGSKTHPPRAERLAAVIAGWEHGRRGNVPSGFNLLNFSAQDCITAESGSRDYSAQIGVSGLPENELSLSELELTAIQENNREFKSYSFEEDKITETIEHQGRTVIVKKRVVSYDFYGPDLRVIATHITSPSWAQQVFETYDFQKFGVIRETQYAVHEWISDDIARVRESTQVSRGCNYSGAPSLWDQ